METETEAVIENGITPPDGVIAIDAPITVTQSPERMSDVVWQNTLPAVSIYYSHYYCKRFYD